MDITWLGHSCFRLRGRDVTIVTDPYDRGAGYPPLRLHADVISVSHEHPNHAARGAVSGQERPPRTVDGPGEYEIAGAMITGVGTYRDGQKGQLRGKNTAFLFELDDLSVCHLGGLGHTLNAEQIESLQDADVLLIPVDGVETLTAQQAVEVVSQLEPKLVIPMYHGMTGLPSGGIERFCKELAVAELTPVLRLSVTKSSLPEETQVAVLTPPDRR